MQIQAVHLLAVFCTADAGVHSRQLCALGCTQTQTLGPVPEHFGQLCLLFFRQPDLPSAVGRGRAMLCAPKIVRRKAFELKTQAAIRNAFDPQQGQQQAAQHLSLIHISEPTRRTPISYAVFCLKKKKTNQKKTHRHKFAE